MSQFIVDLRDPGITIRPILSMNGSHHFNEVVLDDVFVPDDLVFGTIGHGLRIVGDRRDQSESSHGDVSFGSGRHGFGVRGCDDRGARQGLDAARGIAEFGQDVDGVCPDPRSVAAEGDRGP
ncbi:hypothetical protein ROP_30700 [Rhodococcus opacus B4]|uniref:Uncharacterized protein n=1 Tax=Rhodococcus opacus (strain B4) TaxID=632772 RepID=C1B6L4_RHOOB|nr:hypothetical protein ROP_30700 [Rhodococcus opacus B4]